MQCPEVDFHIISLSKLSLKIPQNLEENTNERVQFLSARQFSFRFLRIFSVLLSHGIFTSNFLTWRMLDLISYQSINQREFDINKHCSKMKLTRNVANSESTILHSYIVVNSCGMQISKQEAFTQPAFSCSRSTIETLSKNHSDR